jgi:hypothetical protein
VTQLDPPGNAKAGATWQLTERVLNLPELTVEQIARDTGIPAKTVRNARAGTLTGRYQTTTRARQRLRAFATRKARDELPDHTLSRLNTQPEALLAAYLEHRDRDQAARRCARDGCPNPARPRGRYCDDRCARADAEHRRRQHRKATA